MSDTRDDVIESAEKNMMLIEYEVSSETSIAHSVNPIAQTESPSVQSEIKNAEPKCPMAQSESPSVQSQIKNAQSELANAESESPEVQSKIPKLAAEKTTPILVGDRNATGPEPSRRGRLVRILASLARYIVRTTHPDVENSAALRPKGFRAFANVRNWFRKSKPTRHSAQDTPNDEFKSPDAQSEILNAEYEIPNAQNVNDVEELEYEISPFL